MILAETTPTWLTLVAAIGLGGLFGTLLTINHQRGAEFRERMLNVADEFLQALAQAGTKLGERDRYREEYRDDPGNEEFKTALVEAQQTLRSLLVTLHSNLARISLIFGIPSPTYNTADAIVEALTAAVVSDDGAASEEAAAKIDVAATTFTDDVRRAVRQTALRRLTRR